MASLEPSCSHAQVLIHVVLWGDQTTLRHNLNAIALVALFHDKPFRLKQIQKTLDATGVFMLYNTNANMTASLYEGSI